MNELPSTEKGGSFLCPQALERNRSPVPVDASFSAGDKPLFTGVIASDYTAEKLYLKNAPGGGEFFFFADLQFLI